MPGYVEQNLIKDENVLYRGTLSPWAFAGRIALGLVLVPFGIGLLLLLGIWIWIRNIELAVTNKRIIVKTGFIARETIELNLGKVESLQVNQGVWGRICNYGSIQINGTGMSHAPIHGVQDPLAFRRHFMEAQDLSIQARA
jgi:uncharacterized membrane protein YdbT with pleckstrin-like domain